MFAIGLVVFLLGLSISQISWETRWNIREWLVVVPFMVGAGLMFASVLMFLWMHMP